MLSRHQSPKQNRSSRVVSGTNESVQIRGAGKQSYKIYLKTHKGLISISLFCLSCGLLSVVLPKETHYPGNLKFAVDNSSEIEQLNLSGNENSNVAADDTISTLIRAFQSEPILEEIVKELHREYPNLTASELRDNLLIQQVNASDKGDNSSNQSDEPGIIEVDYQDQNLTKLKAVLKSIKQVYLQYDKQQIQSHLSESLQLVEEQLEDVAFKIKQSTDKLTLWQQNYSVLGEYNGEIQKLSDRKLELEQRLEHLELELANKKNQYQLLESKIARSSAQKSNSGQNFILRNGNESIPVSNNVDPNGGEVLLDQKIALIDSQYKNILQANGLSAPSASPSSSDTNQLSGLNSSQQNPGSAFIFGDFKSQIIQQQLDTEIQINAQYSKIASLQGEIQSVRDKLQQIPLIEEKYYAISNQLAQEEAEYQSLLRLKQTIEAEQGQLNSRITPLDGGEVILPEVSDFWPSFILSLLISGGLSYLAYRYFNNLDGTIRHLEQINLVSNQPLLGVIPEVKSTYSNSDTGRIKKFDHESNLQMLKAIRSLALNLCKARRNHHSYVLAISSSFPNEGKSTLIYNLANSLAQLGYKTVLIDADLRKPTLHRLSGLGGGLGLTDALTYGYENNLNELLYRTTTPNLSIMTSGALPPDPLRLLNSKNMKNLVVRLKQEYEYVLFDCPPMIVDSDISAIARYCHGTMLVCRLGLATHNSLGSSLNKITQVRQSSFLGVIANYYDGEFKHQHDEGQSTRQLVLSNINHNLTDQLSFLRRSK